MRSRSFSTQTADAYRAGSEIGEAVADLAPEALFLFASVHYLPHAEDLFAGLRDALGDAPTLIAGCSGDGVLERQGGMDQGVAALALTTSGAVQWRAALASGVGADSRAAGRACAEAVTAGAPDPVLAFAFADGVRADGTTLVEGLASALRCPVVGGLAGDDRKFGRTGVLLQPPGEPGRWVEDSVGVVTATGALAYSVHAASGWQPVGAKATVQSSHGSTLRQVGGMTPQAFFREQIGKSFGEIDLGIVPLAVYERDEDVFALRTPSGFDPATGELVTFGSLQVGQQVRVCTASHDDVLRGVEEAVEGARAAGLRPVACLVVSCAGRKWVLDRRFGEELQRVQARLGTDLPLAGFPSFGEIAPFRLPAGGYTRSLFHNATFVACILGLPE